MEIEFDKEMDAILRRARNGKTAPVGNSRFQIPDSKSQIPDSASEHLDADEISAFAENALPEKAKARYIAHFADCDSCRKTLSNLILLNAETESEIVPAEEIAAISSAEPWYRRIFTFPHLAYTMGGLLILFGGIIGFVAVQNFNDSRVSEISQISEKSPMGKGEIIPENNASQSESNFSSVANTNSSVVYSPNAMANSSMNSNMSVAAKPGVSAPSAPKEDLSRESKLPAANKSGGFLLNEQEQSRKEDSPAASVPAEPQATVPPPPADKKTKPESRAQSDSSLSSDQVADLPLKGRQSSEIQKGRVLSAPMPKSKPSETANGITTSVGGKKFNRRNNVWYDANYNEQPVVRITRGTKQYKNLDKDLRVIAENLGGTVVIVWKEKAYRIQ